MRIKWLGHSAFLLAGDSKRIAVDPYGQFPEDRPIKFDYPPLEGIDADLVLVSHEHADHNAAEAIGGDPEIIRARAGTFDSPIGEVVGIASEHDSEAGTQRGANTIFRFTLDGVRCSHLGDFGQRSLRPEQRDAIGGLDVLFVPVGAGPTIDGDQAAEIVSQLEPAVVIPMHYATDAVDFLEGPDRFLDAVPGRVQRVAASEVEAQDYLGTSGGPAVVMLEAPR
jgi:L-ascorbate metabolism protein UlaG (beta-lactamase superfamily)